MFNIRENHRAYLSIDVAPLMLAFVLSNSASGQPSNQWPVDATLSYFYCEKGECNVSNPVISGMINFGTYEFQTRFQYYTGYLRTVSPDTGC